MASASLQFGPFTGYVSAMSRHLLTPDKISEDSLNVTINPFTGELEMRSGSAIVGDTFAAGHEVSGILEASWAARSRKAFPINSRSFSDGLQTHASLWTKDTNSASFPTVDTGYWGQVYVRNELASALKNYSLLSEFSTTTYPPSNGTFNTEPTIKAVPLWYESGDGGYTRGATEMTRRFLASGSRSVVQTDGELLLPNLRGTPVRWDKRINGSTTGTEKIHLFPTGPFAPLWCPVVSGSPTAASGIADSNIKDGTSFYASVLYEDEYGAYHMPAMPRPVNARQAAGFGLITIGAAGGANYFRDFTLRVPIGPAGTKRRIVLACTPEILAAAAAQPRTIKIIGDADSPGLQILAVLENNTQTSVVISGFDLFQNDNIVRFDHVCPRRGRYLFTGDQRVATQVTLPSPCAIMLAPVGATSDYDLNAPDDSATLFGSLSFYYRVDSAGVYLYQYDSAGPTLTEQAFAFVTYTTLQDLVDAINATSVAGTANCKQWRAALAPGVDGTLDSTTLCPTTRTVTGVTCTINLPTIGGGDFTNVPIGALVSDPNFAAGTYVLSKQGTNNITLSANATATAGAHSATFYSYCGDGASSGTLWAVAGPVSKYGMIRAYAGSYPGMIYFRRTAMVGYDRVDTQSVYFTKSSPGDAQSGASLAPNSWVRSNRRLPPPGAKGGSVGRGMGGIDTSGGALVGYTDGVLFLVNERGANTGEDFDVRLKTVNLRRGVLADDSWAAGDGWGGYMTSEGYMVSDSSLREMSLTQDIHNPANGDGSLQTEVDLCIASIDADTDNTHFHAAVLGTELHLTYRNAPGDTYPTRRIFYNFSPGVDASRLEEVIDPESRRRYAWSSPINQIGSCMCEVRRSDGRRRYFTVDTNLGASAGRMDRFDTGTDDNGVAYVSTAYMATSLADPLVMLSVEQFEVIHKSPSGTPRIVHHRDKLRAQANERHLTVSAGSEFNKEVIEFDENSRTNGDVCELVWDVDGVNAGSRLSRVFVAYTPQRKMP